MRRHVLPNIVAPLIVLTTVYFSQAILAEATLSFLGLGTQPPEAAWGNMLATAQVLHRRERLDVDLARARRSCSPCSASTSSATACATSSTRASAAASPNLAVVKDHEPDSIV